MGLSPYILVFDFQTSNYQEHNLYLCAVDEAFSLASKGCHHALGGKDKLFDFNFTTGTIQKRSLLLMF